MNDEMIDIDSDDMLGAALRAEVPPPSNSYWPSIDSRLTAATASDTAAKISPVESGTQDISLRRQQSPGEVRGTLARLRTWPVLAAAAALVLIAGLLAVQLRPGDRDRVDAGFADEETPTALQDLPGPTQNLDHWNAIYGVWDCTANDGDGGWLPAFESSDDDVGIHSHGDGLISIHPFSERSAGRNATFSHFADAMNFTLTNDALTLDDGTVLSEGAMCDGEPAVLEMYRWQDARALESSPSTPPRIIVTENFGDQRFYNDFEVWTLALTPVGSPVPLPPQARFDTLANWWFPLEGEAPVIQPSPIDDGHAISIPGHDALVGVELVARGGTVDPLLEELLLSRPPGLPSLGEQEPGSGTHWSAIAADVRLKVGLVTYLLRDDAPGLEPTISCWEVIEWGGGCTRSGDPRLASPRLEANTGGDIETVVLFGAPDGADWLSLRLTDGHRIIANVVEGASWAAWRVDHGVVARAELLDADHNVLWSNTAG